MHIGQRIKAAREARGWSQGRLAEAVDVGQTTIASWERGRTEPAREKVAKVAVALAVPLEQLELADAGTRSGRPRAPVVGYVGAGSQAHLYAEGQGPFDEVEAPAGATERTVAAEVRGSSIGRNFDGWLVFYDDVRSPVTPNLHGQLCVVGVPDGRILVKWLQPASDGRFHLISETEPPMFDQELLWAAKVTNMRPK